MQRMLVATYLTLFCAATLGVTQTAVAGETALEALQARQEVIAQAQSALDSAPDDLAKQEVLDRAIRETFDFKRLATESLARHWDSITEAQQSEYVRLFVELVQKSTVRTLRNYRAAGTEYVEVLEDSVQVVITTVVTSTSGEEAAIQYKLHRVDGRWWIWDRTIGLDTEITEYDVSSAENYTSAFNRMMREDGIESLLGRLRSKLAGDDDL